MATTDQSPLPFLGPALARKWLAEEEVAGPRPYAVDGAKFRHSNAGGCARALHYEREGVERTQSDLAGHWVMGLGRLVHDAWQQAVAEELRGKGFVVEEEVVCYIDECESAGHADLLVEREDIGRIVVELKTINGVGYRSMLKTNKPRDSALLQGALNAHALRADELEIIYLGMENVGQKNSLAQGLPAASRFSTTFSYTKEMFEPIAEREIDRWKWLLHLEDVPPRQFPQGGTTQAVADPITGKLIGGGSTWRCDYCSFRVKCVDDLLKENGL